MSRWNRWTDEEINLLRELYPNEDIDRDEIADRIGRPWESIKSIAKKFGIRRGGPRGNLRRWTNDDVEMLKHLYLKEKLSEEDLSERMGRSVSSLQNMINRIGISRERIDSWSDEEIGTLRKIYSDHRMSNHDIASSLPRRSKQAIYTKAFEMGLERKWTEEEISSLTLSFPSDVTDEELLSRFPGRTWWSLVYKAGGLGLKRPKEPNPHFWSEKQLALLKENFENPHISRDDLVRMIGRSWDVIRKRAKREGLKRIEPDTDEKKEHRREQGVKAGTARSMVGSREWTKEEDDLLRIIYQDGKVSQEEVCDKLGRSWTSIKARSNKIGISRPRKRYTVRSNYFDDVDTPEKAYWLGFITADGSVSDDNRLKIDLNRKDEEHLKLFRDTIAPDAEVKSSVNRPHMVRFSISDVVLCKGLSRYGIVPRKTDIIEWPQELSDDLWLPFVAGCFDGDGTYGEYGGKLSIRFLGTRNLLEGVRERIEDQLGIQMPPVRPSGGSKNLYALSKTSDGARKILSMMDSCPVRLKRKTFARMCT